MKSMGSQDSEGAKLENRDVRTTETMIRNWVMYSRLIIQRLGRPETHKLIDKAADTARLEPNEEGELVENPKTDVKRSFRELEEEIVETLLPEEDDELREPEKVFFSE